MDNRDVWKVIQRIENLTREIKRHELEIAKARSELNDKKNELEELRSIALENKSDFLKAIGI